jgi:hypothetical protein
MHPNPEFRSEYHSGAHRILKEDDIYVRTVCYGLNLLNPDTISLDAIDEFVGYLQGVGSTYINLLDVPVYSDLVGKPVWIYDEEQFPGVPQGPFTVTAVEGVAIYADFGFYTEVGTGAYMRVISFTRPSLETLAAALRSNELRRSGKLDHPETTE